MCVCVRVRVSVCVSVVAADVVAYLHARRGSNSQREVMKKAHSSSVQRDRCQKISEGKAKNAA